MKANLVVVSCVMFFSHCVAQQKEVAITIDDVPNVRIYKDAGFNSFLLQRIEKMNIPVAIFINEKNIYANNLSTENILGLERWLNSKNVTAGNHSYSHINYADTTLDGFQQDVLIGELLTSKILNEQPAYFRFPFNSLGNDSLHQASIRRFLKDKSYIITPYTIESEDWAFNDLYEEALRNKDMVRAQQVADGYISHTLDIFTYFEKLSHELYARSIRHIYLCHDNQLNTDHLERLIRQLTGKGYSFINLEKALADPVYQSREYYWGRYGFSWIYRWQKDEAKRKSMMRGEPANNILNQR